jgi:arylsulfatase A-like enzyme
MTRRPGVITPGTVYNDIASNEDLLPTFLAAGDSCVKEDLLKGKPIGPKTCKGHRDGDTLRPWFTGEPAASPRQAFLEWTDDGELAALRDGHWKLLFLEQRAVGFDVWAAPYVPLRFPRIINVRMDPLERATDEAPGWGQWPAERMLALVPTQAFVAR